MLSCCKSQPPSKLHMVPVYLQFAAAAAYPGLVAGTGPWEGTEAKSYCPAVVFNVTSAHDQRELVGQLQAVLILLQLPIPSKHLQAATLAPLLEQL